MQRKMISTRLLFRPIVRELFLLFIKLSEFTRNFECTMLLVPSASLILLQYFDCYSTNDCRFNSMCSCSLDKQDVTTKTIHSVSCLFVPFYKFPNLPEASISQLEVIGTKTTILESESLAGCQVQALILTNNHFQHISDRAFRFPRNPERRKVWFSILGIEDIENFPKYGTICSDHFNPNDIITMPNGNRYLKADAVPDINYPNVLDAPRSSSSWKSLTSLDLSYNKLDNVPLVALKKIRNLQWINLHGNQISSINGSWSHMKTSVSTLFLGENDIALIPNETMHKSLRQFKSLIWLNLDGNRILDIPKNSLPTCLKTVSLSYNLIQVFPTEVIADSQFLQWLYLRGNHISLIPQYTFPTMLYMEKIDLGENFISTLPPQLFNKSLNIRDINLSFNDFRMITDNCFSGLNTGRIILSYNSIEKMDFDAFNGITNSLEYLDLDHNNLQRIPQGLRRLNSLKYLYLSSNLLKNIDSGAFDNFSHSLKAISLSGNQLSKIPSEALQNCTKLSHFNIAFNEIFYLEENSFQYWSTTIKSLILANNRIIELKGKAFSQLTTLKELSLSFNPLRYIDKDVFKGLENLESLEMSFSFDNDAISYEIFDHLSNLKWLSLDHNNINVLYPSSFLLPELIYLNLEFNKIGRIPNTFLKSNIHSKIQDIRLSHNELIVIESGTFRALSSLETVLLSNNKIRSIQKEAFSDLPKLTTIILSHNRINSISTDAFTNLQSIGKIDLSDNLLFEVYFNFFTNISGPLHLNLSRNQITVCDSDSQFLNVQILDIRFNYLEKIPMCIEKTSALRKLYLDCNVINNLDQNTFMHSTSLEYLGLKQNNIKTVTKKAFFGLQNLQSLDLSKNYINQLHVGQFANMSQLRIINLSGNRLSYLPKEIFKSTHVEMLDLSSNSFSVVPSTSLSDIGISLRYFSMRSNLIEHIDITTFPDIPLLQYLDLASNRLTILPDNVFTSLGLLQTLDLSSNPLRSNFKELFHYAQTLRFLNLANTGIMAPPHFPLPNLVSLNLSYNNIQAINKFSVQQLSKLKILDLSNNDLKQIPSHLWVYLPSLKTLDISFNPIKEISFDSFVNLHNLQELNIQHLYYLTKFDSDAISQIVILSKLLIQTWPKIENFPEKMCQMFSNIDQLRVLKIYFMETELTDQLLCITNRKIRHLEITGKNLKVINRDAFARFTRNPELLIEIHGTQIEDLPSGLFSNMSKIAHLTLNLKDNMLTHLHPEIFYGNSSRWKSVGTTLISGGLLLSNNPFRCGCHLSWLSHWLRRWTRENLQVHNTQIDAVTKMSEIIKESTCIDTISGAITPIIHLEPEDMSCHASALSNGTYSNNASVIFVIFLTITKYLR